MPSVWGRGSWGALAGVCAAGDARAQHALAAAADVQRAPRAAKASGTQPEGAAGWRRDEVRRLGWSRPGAGDATNASGVSDLFRSPLGPETLGMLQDCLTSALLRADALDALQDQLRLRRQTRPRRPVPEALVYKLGDEAVGRLQWEGHEVLLGDDEQLQRDRLKLIQELQACPSGLCAILKQVVKYGIAYHHSGLTNDEKQIIERGFR